MLQQEIKTNKNKKVQLIFHTSLCKANAISFFCLSEASSGTRGCGDYGIRNGVGLKKTNRKQSKSTIPKL